MSAQSWTCPQCQRRVSVTETRCPECGTLQLLAQASAEQRLLSEVADILERTEHPESPEALVPRLGESLVEQGLITPEQLKQALAYQEEAQRKGKPVRLGQALVALGFLDPETLDRAIAEQIWRLQRALHQANQTLEARVRERTHQLEEALRRLSELNRMKSNFIATVSHELRTPLTHLIGYLELLHSNMLGPLTADQQQAVEVMRRSARELHRLIEDLLRFTLLSRGELTLFPSPTEVRNLCEQVLRDIHPRARAKGVHLLKRIPQEQVWVEADGEKIGWVLAQLLDNGVKFTPPGGEVTLEVRHEPPWVQFIVEDTGIGIPPERLQEIFEPFHQLEEAITRRHGGMGLGLALARQVLEAHNTALEVQSTPGKGSRFAFRLPQANDM